MAASQPNQVVKSRARLNPRHQDMVRAKIQASHIIRRLQSAFDGVIELTREQIEIGKVLLGKSLPDLQRTELTGKDGKDLHVTCTPLDEEA